MLLPPPPFADAGVIGSMWRPLSQAESEYAADLAEVVSAWIRSRRPGIADDDPAARVVTVEVVREALTAGARSGLSSWSTTVAHRSESGTADPAAVDRLITRRHRIMLGLAVTAGPAWSFKAADY